MKCGILEKLERASRDIKDGRSELIRFLHRNYHRTIFLCHPIQPESVVSSLGHATLREGPNYGSLETLNSADIKGVWNIRGNKRNQTSGSSIFGISVVTIECKRRFRSQGNPSRSDDRLRDGGLVHNGAQPKARRREDEKFSSTIPSMGWQTKLSTAS
ncbi:hypothetical protein CISG_08261 [Coccidioides immitis RMSCC 3703]|uniref:Uncharacterized protein n=1 Tax=Coccidioides immitis RMSCC 3703 TaxID=454286 RepID=A0A0J8R8T6_COCIT|nr:hypothetical protein CISG_08261 [Coccidioides immitis RMSCC 3703]